MDKYKITFQTWNKIAQIYQDKFMDIDLYNDTYDLFCNLIEKKDPKVLEIGCGPGNVTKYILAKRPDLLIEAIDIAPNMINLAQKNNPTANFKIMDCREINTLTSKFDAIVCGFCMPYLSEDDCSKLIKDCSGLLNNGGIFYFSTIEGDHSKSGFEAGSSGDKAYVYYYSENYLLELLNKNKFELIALDRKNYPKAGENLSVHMIFIAQKN